MEVMSEITLTGSSPGKATTPNVLIRDWRGDAVYATGTTVPTNGAAKYAKGCLFVDTDVAAGTTGLYCNKGSRTSCEFTAVTQG